MYRSVNVIVDINLNFLIELLTHYKKYVLENGKRAMWVEEANTVYWQKQATAYNESRTLMDMHVWVYWHTKWLS